MHLDRWSTPLDEQPITSPPRSRSFPSAAESDRLQFTGRATDAHMQAAGSAALSYKTFAGANHQTVVPAGNAESALL
jgi:hypothetical protein